MKPRMPLFLTCTVVTLIVTGILVSACKPSAGKFTFQTSSNATVGTYLVDSQKMTVYYYTADTKGKSNIPAALKATWPPVSATSVTVSQDLTLSDFSKTLAGYGANNNQITYKGWPLYYYTGDKSPGDIKGNGIAGFSVVVPSKMSPAR